jgi:hypothetical protein
VISHIDDIQSFINDYVENQNSKWLVELSFINLQKGPVTTDDKIAIARIFETIQSFCMSY